MKAIGNEMLEVEKETPAKSEGKSSLPKPAGGLFGYLRSMTGSSDADYFFGRTESFKPLLRRNLSPVLAGIWIVSPV